MTEHHQTEDTTPQALHARWEARQQLTATTTSSYSSE